MRFDDPETYVAAFKDDPASNAILPAQMIADLRGVTRGAIIRMISMGDLTEIQIGGTRYVQAASYLALLDRKGQEVEQVQEFLEKVASRRETVTYEPVMTLIGLRWQVPAHRTRIGEILGQISEQTYAEHELLLSVLVHRKTSGKTRPGPGFFKLAKYLGYAWDDDNKFVGEESEKVWSAYAPRRKGKAI